MKVASLVFFKIFFVGLLFFRLASFTEIINLDSAFVVGLELTDCEEDQTERSISETDEDFFESVRLEWVDQFGLLTLRNYALVAYSVREQMGEISLRPPQKS